MTASFTPDPDADAGANRLQQRLFRLRDDSANTQLKVRLLMSPTHLLPEPSWRGLRTRLLRMAGWQIGFGTAFFGVPQIYGRGPILERFSIGEWCIVNIGSTFELNDRITIGNRVSIGHQVLFMTTSHEVHTAEQRAGTLFAAPITVGNGAWIGARAILLPGVNVGDGAVVGAGAVVTRDVPPNVLVAGAPARVVKELA